MSTFKKWIIIFRLHTLSASYIPVTFGTVYAYYRKGSFDLFLFFAMLIASVLIQMATNLFNDYFDYKKGLDNKHSVGKSTALITGDVSPTLIISLAFAFLAIAGILGLYIIIQTSWVIALIGGVSILVGFLYSAGPYPISATPFGEFFSGFFMGTVIIGISYFIQTGVYGMDIFFVSLPFTLLIGAILTANNIRDLDEDTVGGRKTLAILLGKEKAIIFLKTISWLAFIMVPFLYLLEWLPIYSILVFLTAKKIDKALIIFRNNSTPKTMAPGMGLIAKNNAHFGALMILALIIEMTINILL